MKQFYRFNSGCRHCRSACRILECGSLWIIIEKLCFINKKNCFEVKSFLLLHWSKFLEERGLCCFWEVVGREKRSKGRNVSNGHSSWHFSKWRIALDIFENPKDSSTEKHGRQDDIRCEMQTKILIKNPKTLPANTWQSSVPHSTKRPSVCLSSQTVDCFFFRFFSARFSLLRAEPSMAECW